MQFQGGGRVENNFIAADANDLGNPSATVIEREKQSMVAPAIPIRQIGGR
jgi:hypothetical protein